MAVLEDRSQRLETDLAARAVGEAERRLASQRPPTGRERRSIGQRQRADQLVGGDIEAPRGPQRAAVGGLDLVDALRLALSQPRVLGEPGLARRLEYLGEALAVGLRGGRSGAPDDLRGDRGDARVDRAELRHRGVERQRRATEQDLHHRREVLVPLDPRQQLEQVARLAALAQALERVLLEVDLLRLQEHVVGLERVGAVQLAQAVGQRVGDPAVGLLAQALADQRLRVRVGVELEQAGDGLAHVPVVVADPAADQAPRIVGAEPAQADERPLPGGTGPERQLREDRKDAVRLARLLLGGLADVTEVTEVTKRLGGLVLQRVAVLADEAQQRVEGADVGQRAECLDRPLAQAEVGHQVDAGQQHADPVAAPGERESLGREERDLRVGGLEGSEQRLGRAAALA